MDNKKLKALISSIFIVACGVVALLAFVVPYFRYEQTFEWVDNNTSFVVTNYGLFDSEIPVDLSTHFTYLQSRSFLMIFSDIMIILGIVCILVSVALAVLEGLSFIPSMQEKFKKFKHWVGLAVLIIGALFLLISCIFFLFSNNVYKTGASNSGYIIEQFKGNVGWWFMAVCPILGGTLAFRKGLKKLNIDTEQ